MIRTRDFIERNPACKSYFLDFINSLGHYDSRALPSAGILPFAHGFFCSFANNCSGSPTTGDEEMIINDSPRESMQVFFSKFYSIIF